MKLGSKQSFIMLVHVVNTNSPLSVLLSYDYPHILSGQGTAALEVLEQMDRLGVETDAVVIPVGGGGLLAGMATTIKHLNPHVQIIVRLSRATAILHG